MAERIESLARWWTSASNEERFKLLKAACQENRPPLSEVRYAILLAESEAGEIGEG